MRINQNSMAINAYRNLSTNNMSLGKSLEKLSSGFRINRAADDASGLVVSQGLRAQIGGMRQATRNAQDGISVVQTAEGALGEVHNILGRMRDLSVQAANTGSNDTASRAAAQAEMSELTNEVQRISQQTAFGGQNLLDGTYGLNPVTGPATTTPGATTTTNGTGTVTPGAISPADGTEAISIDGGARINLGLSATGGDNSDGVYTAAQVASAVAAAVQGAGVTGLSAAVDGTDPAVVNYTNSSDTAIAISGGPGAATVAAAVTTTAPDTVTPGTTTNTGTLKLFQIGANAGETVEVEIAAVSATGLGIDALDVRTDAAGAITAIDAAIAQVSAQRGELGAKQNRFESMINNLQVTTENLVASESRIRDTDMATEMTNFTKSQILSQASTAMLAQANQVPQSVLSLLR